MNKREISVQLKKRCPLITHAISKVAKPRQFLTETAREIGFFTQRSEEAASNARYL
jgi:hypothetical protein